MNYSGDLVCTPADVARMQRGEGLHLVNLMAGNSWASLVYDRELLEEFAGVDLPWSDGDFVARAGVEYRNDLLGHVHALGPHAPPSRYYAGHERSDQPEDWPPNKAACAELRALGATVGYAHPCRRSRRRRHGRVLRQPALGRGPRAGGRRRARARRLDRPALAVRRRGRRVPLPPAAVVRAAARRDRGHRRVPLLRPRPGVASNPPGWGRVYAHLGDEPLSVAAFKEAVRAGRTVVTNGPWLTFDVDGRGPGAVIDAAVGGCGSGPPSRGGRGDRRAGRRAGDRLRGGRLEHTVDGPTWLAAVARAGPPPASPRPGWRTPRPSTSTSTASAWPGRPPRTGASASSTGWKSW